MPSMNRVLTITSDFGLNDHYPAILKGVLLTKVPQLNIIDVTHNVEPFDMAQGAFFLNHTYRYMPKGSIHVMAIRLYSDVQNQLICFQRDGHYFIGPNNGVFSLMFDDLMDGEVFSIPFTDMKQLAVFDMIGAYVHALAEGVPLHEISNKGVPLRKNLRMMPVYNRDSIRATIIHIDRFENVIVNITEENFERIRQGRKFKIFYNPGMPITTISRHYADVNIGEVLCLFNSQGLLEISIHLGKAASLLNLHKEETVHIDFIN